MPNSSKSPRDGLRPHKTPTAPPGGSRQPRSKTHAHRHSSHPSPAQRLVGYGWKLAGRWLRIGSGGAIVFGIVAALYLTLRTSPTTRTIAWLPHWLDPVSMWMDRHGYLQNVPAYALLALPFMVLLPQRRNRAIAIGILALFAALLECFQFFIPTRDVDWEDIVLSWLGLVIAWGLSEGLHWAATRLRRFMMIPR